jgi:hypothetical protein
VAVRDQLVLRGPVPGGIGSVPPRRDGEPERRGRNRVRRSIPTPARARSVPTGEHDVDSLPQ